MSNNRGSAFIIKKGFRPSSPGGEILKVLLIHQPNDAGIMTVLPLGAACIAAALERAGHEVRQLSLAGDPGEELKSCLADFAADIIGISVRNIDDQCRVKPVFFLDGLREVVACCRGFSRAPIVLGGAGFSIFPQSVLAYLKADFGLSGEGEGAFIQLLDCLQQGKAPDSVPNLFRRDMPPSPPGDCLRLGDWPLPRPERHLVLPHRPNQELLVPVQTRRGCPMGCSYCSTPAIEGERLRCRPVGQVIGQLAEFAEAGCDQFYLVDNTFNLPRDYAEALCDRIIEAGLNINWRAILYPWQVSGRLISKMARAGCVEVSLGSESGSQTLLANYRKRFALDEVRRISLQLREHGIRQLGFWLLGGPGEDRCTVHESIEFFDSLPLDALKITVGLRIYPHTPLAHQALTEGVIAPGEDLLMPRFYLAGGLDGWLPAALRTWAAERPHWLLPLLTGESQVA